MLLLLPPAAVIPVRFFIFLMTDDVRQMWPNQRGVGPNARATVNLHLSPFSVRICQADYLLLFFFLFTITEFLTIRKAFTRKPDRIPYAGIGVQFQYILYSLQISQPSSWYETLK